MSERHNHNHNFLKKIREGGVRGTLAVAVSFAVCPGDDIALIGGAIFSNNPQAETQRAVMPPDDQYELRFSGLETVSGEPKKSLKPKLFKK